MRRRLLLAMMLVGIAVVGGTQILSASASNSPPPIDPFASVVIPSGPELPLSEIETIARTTSARAGEPTPTMSVGKGTLEDAMRSIDPSTTFPETSPGMRKMLGASVVLVVMHGNFTLNDAHVRKGDPAPTGSVLDLVIDAHTGGVVGRALPIHQAGGGLPLASVASADTGVLAGVVLLAGGPKPSRGHSGPRRAIGYKVLIKRGSRVVRTAITSTHGFRVLLKRGSYVVEGTQGICKAVPVIVWPGRTTSALVRCSIR